MIITDVNEIETERSQENGINQQQTEINGWIINGRIED
jgi:hypothetical protein